MKKREIICLMLFVGIIFVSIDVFAASCEGIFTQELLDAMDDWVYKPIKYATPILLLVFTSIDFTKVVFSGTKDGFEKAKKNFLKRALAALVIFFAPDIIKAIVNIIQEKSINSCLNNHFN